MRFVSIFQSCSPEHNGEDNMTDALAHTIADASKVTGIGRTTIYGLIGAGKLDARKAGGRTLITGESLRAFIASLPPAEIRTGQTAAA
jgi:excisionase family DNA binding protein